MIDRAVQFLLLAGALLVQSGCVDTSSNQDGSQVRTNEASSDTEPRYLTDEGTPPMMSVIKYAPVSDGLALVVDADDGLFVIESDRRTQMIGRRGTGPCEFEEITSMSVVGDTVFVLDREQTRIVGYSIDAGDCLADLSHPRLIEFTKIGRSDGWYYLLKSKVSSLFPSDLVLLHRIDDAGTHEPLGLTPSDLQADLLMHPVQRGTWNGEIQVRNKNLYFTIPLTHRVWSYNTQSGEVSSFELEHSSIDISGYADMDNSTVPEILPKLEFESAPFLFEDHLSVQTYYDRT